MSHGHDQNVMMLDTVDHAVGEPTEQVVPYGAAIAVRSDRSTDVAPQSPAALVG